MLIPFLSYHASSMEKKFTILLQPTTEIATITVLPSSSSAHMEGASEAQLADLVLGLILKEA